MVGAKPTVETMDELDLPGENIGLSEVTIFGRESYTSATQDNEIQQHPKQVDGARASTSNRRSGSGEVTSKYISATSELTFHSACDFDTDSAGVSSATCSEFEKATDVETKDEALAADTEIENLMEFTETVLPHHSGFSQPSNQSYIPDQYLQSHSLSTSDSGELLHSELVIPGVGADRVKTVQSLPGDSSDEEKVESDCEAADEHWASESCIDTSEEDRLRVGDQKGSAYVSSGKDAQLQSRVSSHVFVPRRASSRHYRVFRPLAAQDINTQLSFMSTHSQLSQNQESDQAPDLEMDLFDFDPDT